MLKTIAVETKAKDNPDGFYLINADDFDEAVHKKYEGKVPERAIPTEPTIGVVQDPDAPKPEDGVGPAADAK